MALTTADLTRIYKYQAFTLGRSAGGAWSYNEVLTLIQAQINAVNTTDSELGTTFANEIQADLAALDTLDSTLNSNAGQGGIKILGIEDGIEYFRGGVTEGYAKEMRRLSERVARILSQSYEDARSSIGIAYRG